MNTEDVPCGHRRLLKRGSDHVYDCDVHGSCTIDKVYLRIRACVCCSDRTEYRERPPESAGLLGSRLEAALSTVGITKNRVSEWIGRDCHCADTRDKLNQLHLWAMNSVKSSAEAAKAAIEAMLSRR